MNGPRVIPDRVCASCGHRYQATNTLCTQCRMVERKCATCGKAFRGNHRKCGRCRLRVRACDTCGKTFLSGGRRCSPCRERDRDCITCGRSFHSTNAECMTCRWAKMPAERKNRYFADGARLRKQRKIAAQIDGPVPQATYAAVLASGPCVYCGGPAKHVDHVRPLSRGGAEHETNLVPACDPCNRTKAARLLSGWNPDRVEHGIQHSPVVAAEWLRLTEGIDL